MIELLVLHLLNKYQLTMYGVQKKIAEEFAIFTKPSFGTIKPALVRLSEKGFVISRKTFSEGGRVSVFYAITTDGQEELRRLVVARTSDNPVKFLNTARVKLICSSLLPPEDQVKLIEQLSLKANSIYAMTKRLLDNLQEYKNFISLLEGMKNGCVG